MNSLLGLTRQQAAFSCLFLVFLFAASYLHDFRKIALTAELYSGKDFRLVADRAWVELEN